MFWIYSIKCGQQFKFTNPLSWLPPENSCMWLRHSPWISALICLVALESAEWMDVLLTWENVPFTVCLFFAPALLYEISCEAWIWISSFTFISLETDWAIKETSEGVPKPRRHPSPISGLIAEKMPIVLSRKCLFINIPSFQLVGTLHESNFKSAFFNFNSL